MRTFLLAVALVAWSIAPSSDVRAQGRPAGDIRITRAIYGTVQGSADVTPVVTELAQPGRDEFYTAPKWLEVDPAVGQAKDLVIFYVYRGAPHVLTLPEFTAASNTILVEHADSAARRRPVLRDTAIVLVRALYGQNRIFQDVTTRASQLIRRGSEPFVVSDTTFLARATTGDKVLMITYSYKGIRTTWMGWVGRRVSYAALVAHADGGGQARLQSDVEPDWVKDAQPNAPRAPGAPNPNAGTSPRREAGISALLKAVADLEAVDASDRPGAVTAALAATKKALADAQENLGYPYPSPTAARPVARGTATADHRANALRSLTMASDSLGAANSRGRAAAAANTRTIADINEAIAALTGTSVPLPPPVAGRGRGGRAAAAVPRRELAISALVLAVVELEAIDARNQPGAVATALAATKNALADAQENLGYPYPPAGSPRPDAAVGSTTVHRAIAEQSLKAALEHFSGANPARGRAAQTAMTRCIAEINKALAALR